MAPITQLPLSSFDSLTQQPPRPSAPGSCHSSRSSLMLLRNHSSTTDARSQLFHFRATKPAFSLLSHYIVHHRIVLEHQVTVLPGTLESVDSPHSSVPIALLPA